MFLCTMRTASRRAASMLGLVMAAWLSGCALPPERSPAPALYDFGSRPLAPATPQSDAARPVLGMTVLASAALDGSAMLYRLAYGDEQQLRSYTLARWAMPPAELVQQRLSQALGAHFTVLRSGESAARVLQIELEEFSQVFDSPGQSVGRLRLRATVLQVPGAGSRVLGQRVVMVQQPAPSTTASGGVQALGSATDAAAMELVQWLQQLR
jgi:cholesterol transport system auxiliary component